MKVYKENINELTEDEYILVRKDSFGASDVASLFGIGFQTLEQVIAQKQKKFVTEEEREIGRKPNVRKGKDLEPLILQKTMEALNVTLVKPNHMFEILPGLTVNFDAICADDTCPYELKYVTTFGKKDWTLNVNLPFIHHYMPPDEFYRNDIQEHIKYMAAIAGIPVYYYTQIQTQLIGTNKKMGYVCALFEHDWTLRVYRIYRDPYFEIELRKIVPQYAPRLMETPKEESY